MGTALLMLLKVPWVSLEANGDLPENRMYKITCTASC